MNRHCSEVMLLLGKSMLSTCWMFDMNIVKSFPCQWIVPIRYACQLWQLFRLKCHKYYIESQHCSTLLVDRQPTVFRNTPDTSSQLSNKSQTTPQTINNSQIKLPACYPLRSINYVRTIFRWRLTTHTNTKKKKVLKQQHASVFTIIKWTNKIEFN